MIVDGKACLDWQGHESNCRLEHLDLHDLREHAHLDVGWSSQQIILFDPNASTGRSQKSKNGLTIDGLRRLKRSSTRSISDRFSPPAVLVTFRSFRSSNNNDNDNCERVRSTSTESSKSGEKGEKNCLQQKKRDFMRL